MYRTRYSGDVSWGDRWAFELSLDSPGNALDDGILKLRLLQEGEHWRSRPGLASRFGCLEEHPRIPGCALHVPVALRHVERCLRIMLQIQCKSHLLASEIITAALR